jgi:hypothetical protein
MPTRRAAGAREILRFAQDDMKKKGAEFGIWTLTRRSMTSVGLALSGRG